MQIFLGYAREDLQHAKDVAECLRDAGHEVWRDGDFLVGGDDWNEERLAGQKEAGFIVHLISPAINRRRSVAMREIRTSLKLFEDEPFGSNLAMFMRVEEFPVPTQLTAWHYVDKFREGWQADLLRAVDKRKLHLEGREPAAAKMTPILTAKDIDPAEVEEFEAEEGIEGFDSRARYFKYRIDKPYWELVNASIASRVLSYHIGWRSQAEYFMDGVAEGDRELGLWQESIASEFFRGGEFVSIRIYYHYYSGGAHPSHGVESLNFLGDVGGAVSIRELLNYDDDSARSLAVLCFERIVAKDGTDDDGSTFALTSPEDMAENAWNGLSRFTFDRQGLTFTFPPYEVLPYASGMPEAFVTWEELGDRLAERYRKVIADLISGRDTTG